MNAHTTINEPSETFDADHYIGKLVALKDKIAALEDEHEKALEPYKKLKEKLEKRILGYLLEIKAQNISTPIGTASVLHRKSASLEDPQAFMNYVIANQAWDLIDRKPNTKAVEDFIKEHGVQPPGAKFSDSLALGLRRK